MILLEEAIWNALHGDTGAGGIATLATGGIWAQMAPQNQLAPYVTYGQFGHSQASYTLKKLAADELLYYVKSFAIDTITVEGPLLTAQIIERARTLLTDASLAVAAKTVGYFRFDKEIQMPPEFDQSNGRFIYSRMAIFRAILLDQ